MNHFSRPYRSVGLMTIGVGVWLAIAPPGALAQMAGIVEIMQDPSPMLMHSNSSQGYLGVDFVDVDQEKAQTLKLKDVRGAVITLIDHDAPAGQAGMRVNDVVIQLNGQNVEGAEQLKRMLKEIPPGHKVSIEISRDGNVQTMAVELVDHRALGHDIWKKIGHGDEDSSPSTLGMLTGTGDTSSPSVFKMPIFGSTLNVGAMVEPLTSQMADYLGVPNGLMVKQVARKSEAAAAGLKAFDVILKVGTDSISTSADWDRALHANTGKPVQVTILRDRKQQTLTLQVDSKHKTGLLEMQDVFGDQNCPLIAELDQNLEGDALLAAQMLSEQAEALKDSIHIQDLKIDPKQMDEAKKQLEELSKSFDGNLLKVDPKLAEELGKSFKIEDFKVDSKQAEELKKQMDEFSRNFRAEDFKIDQKQLDEMKKQMEEFGKNFKTETAPY